MSTVLSSGCSNLKNMEKVNPYWKFSVEVKCVCGFIRRNEIEALKISALMGIGCKMETAICSTNTFTNTEA